MPRQYIKRQKPMTGEEIKAFREQLGFSQTLFGVELGFLSPQSEVSDLERGARPVTERVRRAIMRWKKSVELELRLEQATRRG